jgi:hypothetical protein
MTLTLKAVGNSIVFMNPNFERLWFLESESVEWGGSQRKDDWGKKKCGEVSGDYFDVNNSQRFLPF